MKQFFEMAPKVAAVASFAVLLLTVIHESGYFYVLGWHLQSIATTYDYITNALIWLPTTASILGSAQAIEAAMEIRDGRVRLSLLFYFVWLLPVAFIVAALLLGGSGTSSVGFTSFLGVSIIYFLVKRIIPQQWLIANWNFRFALLVPLPLFLMFGYGISNGYTDLKKTTDVYAVDQKERRNPIRQLVLLRSFERGLLVREAATNRVEFIRWDNINSLSRLVVAEKSVGYLCYWFDVACVGYSREPIVP